MQLFLDSPGPALVAWSVLFASDYAFTMSCARMYAAGVREILVFEGSFELTPFFQEHVDSLRTIGPRVVVGFVWGAVLVTVVRLAARDAWPDAYLFALGAIFLVQLAVHVRHLRNFVLFRQIRAGAGLRGRIEYPRPLVLRLSAVELFSFAFLYLALFAATQSAFVFGGAAGCAAHAAHHLRLAARTAA